MLACALSAFAIAAGGGPILAGHGTRFNFAPWHWLGSSANLVAAVP